MTLTSSLKRIGLVAAAAAATAWIGAATPAEAQYYGGPAYGYGAPGYVPPRVLRKQREKQMRIYQKYGIPPQGYGYRAPVYRQPRGYGYGYGAPVYRQPRGYGYGAPAYRQPQGYAQPIYRQPQGYYGQGGLIGRPGGVQINPNPGAGGRYIAPPNDR